MGKSGILAGVLIALGAVLAAGDEEIILKSRRFVPSPGLSTPLRSRLRTTTGRVHVLIQLEAIPTTERRNLLSEAGVRLLSYIPDRAWFASIPADGAAEIAGLAGVKAICEILLEDKLARSMRDSGINAYSLTSGGQAKLTASLFPDVALGAGAAAVESLGGAVLSRDPIQNTMVFRLPIPAIRTLASHDGIKWIDQHYASVDLNDGARLAVNVNAVQAPPYNLTGSGVIIGQWEGGGHPDPDHLDLAGRVVNIADGRAITNHATLMAGIMIGDGSLLDSRLYRGMAPGATIVSYSAWENAGDLRTQYRQAIDAYAIDISNNSWGKVEWNDYKDYTAALDDIVRGSLGRPVPMVWAGGNEGNGIMSTAVGKNVVTVGAVNSDDYTLLVLSNRGPTGDGRLKPDVVAPGCEARSSGSIWSTLPGNRYGPACGTSAAAAVVSGTMALILQDWRSLYGGDPLPSTIKGVLIHTATDLGRPGPDFAFGYGLVNARRAIDLIRADAAEEIIVEDEILLQDEQDVYRLEVPRGETELRISLVWDDYPADPLAAGALVNDLDLVVTAPTGKRHYPWHLDPYEPDFPAGRIMADHTNNVEQVWVESPTQGTWQIAVVGASVPQPHQTYSLLMSRGGLNWALPASPVLSIAGLLGTVVAEFDDAGNLTLQGSLTTNAEPVPPPGAFVVPGPGGIVLAYIDLTGNMVIRGELSELSDCSQAVGGFPIVDWLGNTVAQIDAAGNLCLTGQLYPNRE